LQHLIAKKRERINKKRKPPCPDLIKKKPRRCQEKSAALHNIAAVNHWNEQKEKENQAIGGVTSLPHLDREVKERENTLDWGNAVAPSGWRPEHGKRKERRTGREKPLSRLRKIERGRKFLPDFDMQRI